MKNNKFALESLEKVHQFEAEDNLGRAFAHYLVFFEFTTHDISIFESHFSQILLLWAQELESKNQTNNANKCYIQALHYFPNSIDLLNYFGIHLLRANDNFRAKEYLERGHSIRPNYLPIEKNLTTAKHNLIERWHFRMLNDMKRNEPYFNSITSAIDERFNKVLDIGTGCGLLSLFASRNPATAKIYAIEESKTLYEISKRVFEINHTRNIQMINKFSYNIERDSIQRSNVLVTEIFDTALFGEYVLETLIHAHKCLLEKPCKIIPSQGDVYITGVESFDLYKKYRFSNTSMRLQFGDLIIVCETADNPYEAYRLNKWKHKILTATQRFVTVRFDDLNQLIDLYSNKNAIKPLKLEVIEDGALHAFAVWFNLHLEGELIGTAPSENSESWEQAIFFINQPINKTKGDCVKLHLSCVDNKLEIFNFNDTDIVVDFTVPKCALNFLNDANLIEYLEKCSVKCIDRKSILDLFPIPIFGLLCLLQGSQILISTTREIELTRRICTLNNIDFDKIIFIDSENLLVDLELHQYRFDVIAFDPVNTSGTINENFYGFASYFTRCLNDGGVFVPQNVELCLQLIESEYLQKCNKVDDSCLFGFKIADFINEYSGDEHWFLDEDFPKFDLSNIEKACDILRTNDDPIENTCSIKATKSGNLNSILCTFRLSFNDIYCTTIDCNNYFYKFAVILNSQQVKKNQYVTINIKQHRGFLKCNRN